MSGLAERLRAQPKAELHVHLVGAMPREFFAEQLRKYSPREAFSDAESDTQDGLRLEWSDRWVHVRPSGTEPIVRVIAEAPTAAEAADLIARCRVPLDALAMA